HLSPLGFAACQSKKCTNQEECIKAAWLVQRRPLHPLFFR
ncbi:hypothetical protein HMPREF0673_00341, partial [Leyella stercorea DSM 18206]